MTIFIGGAIAAAAGIGGALITANSQKSAAKSAANAQTAASDQQIALQREQNAKAETAMAPYVARGNDARSILDARWSGPPDPRAAAYGPQTPGGPYGPMSAASAYGPTPSVYGAQGAPRASVQVGNRTVPQVGVPTRPPPAAPAAPRWQSIQASGLPPLPQWNPQGQGAPAAPAPQQQQQQPGAGPLANIEAVMGDVRPLVRGGAGASRRGGGLAERRLVMRQ